jgi:uncharacterized membrane protein YozB (DUF420 family)
LVIGVTVAALVFYGFSHTADQALIHFKGARPPLILYVHALASSAWLFLFIAQSTLVRTRNVRLHRRLGPWGLALGAAVCLVGLDTVYVMRWRDIESGGGEAAVAFLSIPLDSLAGFAIPFLMAAWWRKMPEIHRRLMLLATCTLTFAALSRVPALGDSGAPVVTDALLIAAALADWLGTRRIHPVYAIGIPAEIALQLLSSYLALAAPPLWLAIARFLLGAP